MNFFGKTKKVTKTRTGKRYTTGAVSFLRKSLGKLTTKKIAAVLHRTTKSVARKAEKLGLSRKVR